MQYSITNGIMLVLDILIAIITIRGVYVYVYTHAHTSILMNITLVIRSAFFHTSVPWARIWIKLAGCESLRSPTASCTVQRLRADNPTYEQHMFYSQNTNAKHVSTISIWAHSFIHTYTYEICVYYVYTLYICIHILMHVYVTPW